MKFDLKGSIRNRKTMLSKQENKFWLTNKTGSKKVMKDCNYL